MASLIAEYRSPLHGEAVSLGGIRSRPDSTIVLRHWRVTVQAAVDQVIVGPEPRRLWSLTVMSTANVGFIAAFLTMGTPALGIGIPFTNGGDSLQLDHQLPWAGPINSYSAGAGGNIDTFEAVLE